VVAELCALGFRTEVHLLLDKMNNMLDDLLPDLDALLSSTGHPPVVAEFVHRFLAFTLSLLRRAAS
jgi:hypothetical protein